MARPPESLIRPMHTPRSTLLLLVAALLAPAVRADISTESPFQPAGAGEAPAQADGETWQLAGLFMSDDKPQVCLFHEGRKQSVWLPVGGRVDDLTVVSCDIARDSAVVPTASGEKTLRLKKSQGPVAGTMTALPPPPPPPAAPTAPAAPAEPLTSEEQVEGARNFIGDMLDIGQRQRIAYEEAQRKAKAEQAAKEKAAKR